MNTSIAQAIPVLAVIGLLILLVLGAVSIWNAITDDKKKGGFAIVAFLVLSFLGYIVLKNGEPDSASHSKLPPPPTAHELAIHKELAADREDTRIRQKAFLDSQAAQLTAEREHAAKQKEQEIKAEKLKSKTDTLERLTKIGEGQLELLKKISQQKPPVVTNHVVFQAPPATNIVNVAPSTATITVQAPAVTNIVHVAPAATPPVTVQNVVTNVTVVQPTPVTFTITNVTSGTLTSALTTQAVVTPKPATPAPTKASTPPAPKESAKVRAPKAPATPAVAPKNTTTKTVVTPAPKAPAFKAGRVLVKHVSTVTLNKGMKDWWGIGVLARKLDGRESKGGQVITREYTLAVDVKTQEDLAIAQSALDLFLAHKAKELADNDDFVKDGDIAQQANLAKLFNVFVSQRPSLNPLSGMNPEIKFKVLPGPTGT